MQTKIFFDRGIALFLVIFLTLGSCAATKIDPISKQAFAMLDSVRENRKAQLQTYLAMLEERAFSVHSDEFLQEFFKIKQQYYELQKTEAPPEKLVGLIDTLKGQVQDHYLNNYLLFYDILFVDKGGDVFFTIRKQPDYHKNIFDGHLGKTKLSKHLQKKPQERYVDYFYYDISDEPSAFIVEPYWNNGSLTGWFVFQCAINKINSLFLQEKDLGRTGEVFLVNKQYFMLTDSRFTGESTILRRNLSQENIEWKFLKKKGNTIVIDYRGFRALSSFEVFPAFGSEWLLVAKIDEDEVFDEYFKKNKDALMDHLITDSSLPLPKKVMEFPKKKEVLVDLDEFRKVVDGEILYTSGVSTCTSLTVTLPGKFGYLAHISPYDVVYEGTKTDLIGQVLRRIFMFDIYSFEKRNLQFTIVAKHTESLRAILDKLSGEGILLSQITFMRDKEARYANVYHEYMTNTSLVTWEQKSNEHTVQSSLDQKNLGEIVKRTLSLDNEGDAAITRKKNN